MKNRIFILLWALFLLTGCKDFLVQEPMNSFTDEDFWTSESSVRAFSLGYYADRFPGFGNSDTGGSFSNHDKLHDDYTNIALPGFAAAALVSGGDWDGDNNYFKKLRKDNIFIDRVSKMTAFPDNATAKHWIGIARFFRALDYSNFVFDFGDVPYYDQALTDQDTTLLYKTRDKATFVMDKVLEDFNYASQNVKIDDPLTGPRGQVVNKDVVDAFMARQMLFVGTKIKYDPNSSQADKAKAAIYIQAAKDAAARVMASGRYSVADNYQKICSTIDMANTAAVKKEMILFRVYDVGQVTHQIASGNNPNAQQQFAAPKDVIDSYLCTNGMPINTTTGINPLYLGDQTFTNQFKNRDPRLANTFNTDKFYLQYVETGYSASGFSCYKFLDIPTKDQTYATNNQNITDAPIIRYGEVLLSYIEAAAELADMGLYTVTQTDIDQTINALRKRAGYVAASRLPDLQIVGGKPAVGGVVYDDADRDPSVPSFIWEVRRERRMELIYEGFRLLDLKRWRKINYCNTETYPKKNLGAYVTKTGTTKGLVLADINGNVTSAGGVTTGSGYIKVSLTFRNATNGYVLDRNYLQSIPTYQITLYQNKGVTLTQNPGW